ncbi:hypothetical protein AAG906_039626 [Vitis piasezkii]|uniref:Stomagen C-terminal domain-containing protein n=3 Tax=Vitis vinifera TaxID=29760 RepID=A0ABY9BZH5_VITVI|nr:uncharacterized protein LOC104879403 isoform X1 [Vitis vinifera]XP_034686587.1 uncharacterized protein LOC117915122 isoform X1 [Vitis riparia]XP_034686813.1 uncharacterized protein LOC117915360 isoform X1 [Vitis riparia]RVW62507.1 Epidermal patterning factor-like protein 9 [Vitis vinifera]WJZ87968.1 hypothetical protein VitviT2T_007310 [Vitis vinifera]|eukprot:XP_010650431.1 PREDICTED: uncharacterized protein LOC104879403 [Vitis vinifera]
MATANLQFLFSSFLLAALLIAGTATHSELLHQQGGFNSYPSQRVVSVQNNGDGGWRKWGSRREMIGSTAPTCTYNECKGCKFKCRAEQIPVDGNDPIHSAYHYKCMCHR